MATKRTDEKLKTPLSKSELNDLLCAILKVGTEEYYLNCFHLARVREFLGGVKATDSSMFMEGVEGLTGFGWSGKKITAAIEKEYST